MCKHIISVIILCAYVPTYELQFNIFYKFKWSLQKVQSICLNTFVICNGRPIHTYINRLSFLTQQCETTRIEYTIANLFLNRVSAQKYVRSKEFNFPLFGNISCMCASKREIHLDYSMKRKLCSAKKNSSLNPFYEVKFIKKKTYIKRLCSKFKYTLGRNSFSQLQDILYLELFRLGSNVLTVLQPS
jgi:hypothetical protein